MYFLCLPVKFCNLEKKKWFIKDFYICSQLWQLNALRVGKKQFILFPVYVFREHMSICIYASFSFDLEDGL